MTCVTLWERRQQSRFYSFRWKNFEWKGRNYFPFDLCRLDDRASISWGTRTIKLRDEHKILKAIKQHRDKSTLMTSTTKRDGDSLVDGKVGKLMSTGKSRTRRKLFDCALPLSFSLLCRVYGVVVHWCCVCAAQILKFSLCNNCALNFW